MRKKGLSKKSFKQANDNSNGSFSSNSDITMDTKNIYAKLGWMGW